MHSNRHGRPTAGVLVGWQVYEVFLHSFLALVFRGIRSAAQELGCNLLFACGMGHVTAEQNTHQPSSAPHPAWPVLAPDSDFVPVGPWNTDGLIVVNPLLSGERSRYVHDLISAGYPVVFVGDSEGGPAVIADGENGIRQALAHLDGHGHRRVAFIAGFEGEDLPMHALYLEAGKAHGLQTGPDLIAYGHNSISGGEQAMRQILAGGASFTAILARNDEAAIGAMRVLKQAGLRIPEDVAVIGFDDRPEAGAQEPPLTSIHVPSFEMGSRALALLLRRITGQADQDAIVRVPTHLAIRESCGCSPGATTFGTAPRTLLPAMAAPPTAREPVQALAQTMADAVLSKSQYLRAGDVVALCRQLAETFSLGLEKGNEEPFRLAIKDTLRRAEETGDTPHAWQAALSVLEERSTPLPDTMPQPETYRRMAGMLRVARTAISACVYQQHMQYVVDQSWLNDQAGLLTARLLGAVNEEQVFNILEKHLPGIDVPGFGIHHAAVAFYEAEGGDPVAWSILRTIPDPRRQGNVRVPSREFPPEGMFPTDEPFSLALLPLIAGKEVKGFVAFDGTNLGLCAIIVWQLAAAFRSIELYREALEARRLAEEANQMKSRFLSTVSHELRTPLNLVVGLSEMLLVEQQGGELELTRAHLQDVERIHASAQHLDGLMRDVLDLAQSETGRLTLTCEPLDLASVLRPLIAAGEQMAQEKNLAWRAEIDDDLPQVWGDRTRLRQVILNLLSNAVKFTARGEVALRVEVQSPIADRGSQTANRQIANCLLPIAGRKSPIADGQLPTTDGNAMRDKRLAIGDMRVIVVSVSDTGLGIPPSEQTAIFDEFRQSERTATRGYGGMGLGLAICRRLVELHGGRIEAHSSGEEGGGSTFIVALPAMETRAPDPAEIRSEAREQTVLLLCEQGREELEQHLTGQGFVVETMEPTEAALVTLLARLRAAPPGAVVLDAGLASRQGWRVLAALKQDPATIEVPVLFYALEPRENSGALLEMDYLTKPVGTAELAQALQRQGLVTQEEAKTILVVDDEPGILEMHARIIQSQLASCRVLRAGNGRDALALLKAEQPDLVLLDLMMPELDGFGVLEKMRAQETTRDVPVIVLTGQLLTEREMDRLNQGVAAVLGKGLFTAEETLAHVESALARTRRLGSDARRMVRRAMAFIHEHHAEAISSKTIAHHLGVSKGHLSRSFRQEMDLTPTKYLNRYRVQRAKELLAAGDTSVTEVAMAVGFSDASYFSRIFRREVGIPPTDYRLAESEDR